jgi:MoaA/NifB/PqqE/SkfB family radical SAM enzyme
MLNKILLESPKPIVLDINPTDNCNLACLSCWKRNPKYKKLDPTYYELSDKRLMEVIDEASQLGIKEVEITGGGEPLLRNITQKLMESIKKKNMKGSITTNGVLIDKQLAEKLVRISWDRVVFSLDGPNREVNDYLRGKSFDKIIQNINLINKYKNKTKRKKPVLYFNVVISNKNYNLIGDFIKLAEKLNVEFVKFETLTAHSRLGRKLQLNKNQKKEFLNSIKKYEKKSKQSGVKTNIKDFDNNLLDNPNRMTKKLPVTCLEPFYHIVIKTDGSVGPCCLFYGNAPNVKNESLQNIWKGDYFKKIRDRFINNKKMPYCKICNIGQVSNNLKYMEISNGKRA